MQWPRSSGCARALRSAVGPSTAPSYRPMSHETQRGEGRRGTRRPEPRIDVADGVDPPPREAEGALASPGGRRCLIVLVVLIDAVIEMRGGGIRSESTDAAAVSSAQTEPPAATTSEAAPTLGQQAVQLL